MKKLKLLLIELTRLETLLFIGAHKHRHQVEPISEDIYLIIKKFQEILQEKISMTMLQYQHETVEIELTEQEFLLMRVVKMFLEEEITKSKYDTVPDERILLERVIEKISDLGGVGHDN